MRKVLFGLAALLALAACQTADDGDAPAVDAGSGGSVSDISDFVGARAGQAEGGLNRRGYQLVRTQGLTAYWWNAFSQTCAEIVTDNGRYASVRSAPESDCFF